LGQYGRINGLANREDERGEGEGNAYMTERQRLGVKEK
jgi:hypothetical protein